MAVAESYPELQAAGTFRPVCRTSWRIPRKRWRTRASSLTRTRWTTTHVHRPFRKPVRAMVPFPPPVDFFIAEEAATQDVKVTFTTV